MKHLTCLFLLILLSCEKVDTNTIPGFIKINDISLNSNISTNITDAWVYIDDNLQGVYELPTNFPILEEGIHKLRIKAGIKDNGIGGTRIPYPFYSDLH